MGGFNKYINTDVNNTPFRSVIFGDNMPVLEVELNEMQELLHNKVDTMNGMIIPDMFIDKPIIKGLTSDVIHLSIGKVIANGMLFDLNVDYDHKIESTSDDKKYYVFLWYELIDVDRNTDVNNITPVDGYDNTIKDSRYNIETTRRKVVSYGIECISGDTYIDVTMDSGGYSPGGPNQAIGYYGPLDNIFDDQHKELFYIFCDTYDNSKVIVPLFVCNQNSIISQYIGCSDGNGNDIFTEYKLSDIYTSYKNVYIKYATEKQFDKFREHSEKQFNEFKDSTDKQLEEIKKSASDGKGAISSAITDMGISTESDDTFENMAKNIKKIKPDYNEYYADDNGNIYLFSTMENGDTHLISKIPSGMSSIIYNSAGEVPKGKNAFIVQGDNKTIKTADNNQYSGLHSIKISDGSMPYGLAIDDINSANKSAFDYRYYSIDNVDVSIDYYNKNSNKIISELKKYHQYMFKVISPNVDVLVNKNSVIAAIQIRSSTSYGSWGGTIYDENHNATKLEANQLSIYSNVHLYWYTNGIAYSLTNKTLSYSSYTLPKFSKSEVVPTSNVQTLISSNGKYFFEDGLKIYPGSMESNAAVLAWGGNGYRATVYDIYKKNLSSAVTNISNISYSWNVAWTHGNYSNFATCTIIESKSGYLATSIFKRGSECSTKYLNKPKYCLITFDVYCDGISTSANGQMIFFGVGNVNGISFSSNSDKYYYPYLSETYSGGIVHALTNGKSLKSNSYRTTTNYTNSYEANSSMISNSSKEFVSYYRTSFAGIGYYGTDTTYYAKTIRLPLTYDEVSEYPLYVACASYACKLVIHDIFFQ